jgi:hypothetical protein
MAKQMKTQDDRVHWLTEELLLAKEQMAGLASRIEALERGVVLASPAEPPAYHDLPPASFTATCPHPKGFEDDSSWTHLGHTVLLPRVAAVSFMLVVALILRTVTDNGMIGLMAGSMIGMAYAATLIAAGVFLYSRHSLLAPVFPTCGALLLYSIIFETQGHFSSLSGEAVYLILLLTEVVIVSAGVLCRAKVLLYVAIFASTVVGIAIGLPNPRFIPLCLIILVNSLAAHLASERQISHTLRWYSLIFALIFWMLWAYKLNFAFTLAPKELGRMGLTSFLPLLFVFWAFYTYTSLRQALKGEGHLGVFHNILPAVVAGGTFFAANAVLNPWVGRQQLVGGAAVLVSAFYLGLVTWLARRGEDAIPGGKEFVTAGTVLLIQGMAISVPPLWALPVWTVAAGILTLRADQWRSGGIRLISYLFQIFVLFFAIRHQSLSVLETAWPAGVLITGLIAGGNLWLYRWCRRHPPDNYDSAFFTVFDKGDYTAVALLGLGLAYSFAAGRFLLFALLPSRIAEAATAFACTQSVIVNSGIVFLLLLGLKRRDKEIVTVAGLVVLIAAIKVFLFDLLRGSGLPLVFSVFSFGVVAATSSVVMRKWHGGRTDGERLKVKG